MLHALEAAYTFTKHANVREVENQIAPIIQTIVNLTQLKNFHAYIIKSSLSQSNFLTTKLIDLCNNLGDLHYADTIFRQVHEPNIFLYNAVLRAYTRKHVHTQVIAVYKEIIIKHDNIIFPDRFTFPIVYRACAGLLCVNIGRQVHGHGVKFGPVSNPVLENSLMDMYTKCGDFGGAQKVFDEMIYKDVVSWNTIISGHARLGQMKKARGVFELMPEKTVVSWTALISGYTRVGCYGEALEVFRGMQMVGLRPDEISIVAVLPACAQLGALEVGKWIHIYAEKNGLLKEVYICNALIEMYAKCGCVDQAWELFGKMLDRDVISWSTMIGALANHGRAREAIRLFVEMEKDGVEPNGVTFLGVLSACTHAGLLAEGLHYLDSMKRNYFIEPSVEHYGCIVDLLGRLGRLEQALELINKMSVKPDSSVWGSLLSACRNHGNLEIAVKAMEQLLVLEPDDIGNYVLLSNLYADLGEWGCVSSIRKVMRSKRMKKTPGCSSIEVNNVVQEFVVGDDSNQLSDEIYCMLDLLALQQSSNGTIRETLAKDILSAELENPL